MEMTVLYPFIVQVFQETRSHWVNAIIYPKGGFEKAIHWLLLRRFCFIHSLFMSSGESRSLSRYNSFTWEMVLKWSFTGDTEEETLHVHCSGTVGDRALCIGSYSWEMAGKSVVTMWGEAIWLGIWSPGTDLSKLVDLHLGDGLEIAGDSGITLGKTVLSLLIHIMILKCLPLCATWQSTSNTEALITREEYGHERKKNSILYTLGGWGVKFKKGHFLEKVLEL